MEKIDKKVFYNMILSNFIKQNGDTISREKFNTINTLIIQIVDEFFDVKKRTIIFENERSTYVLRKIYGVFDNGEMQSEAKIASSLNLAESTIYQLKKKCLRDYQNLLLAYKNKTVYDAINRLIDKITLSNKIEDLYLDNNTILALHSIGIKTIADLASTKESTLKTLPSLTPKSLLDIKTKLNSLKRHLPNEQLSLKDIVLETNIEYLFNELGYETINQFKKYGIINLKQVIDYSSKDLLRKFHIFKSKREKISAFLNKYDLSLKPDIKIVSQNDPIESLNLSKETIDDLKSANILSVNDFLSLNTESIASLTNISKDNQKEIINLLINFYSFYQISLEEIKIKY